MEQPCLASDSDADSVGDDDEYVELPDVAAANFVDVSGAGQEFDASYRCLFCNDPAAAQNADDLIGRHLPESHGVAIGNFLIGAGLTEQADWVRLVAFLRRCQAATPDSPPQSRLEAFLAWRLASGQCDGEGDSEMIATDDPLMYEVDIDDLLLTEASGDKDSNKDKDKDRRIRDLEEQVASLRSQMAGMSALLRRFAGGGCGGCGASADAESSDALSLPRTVAELTEDDDGHYVDSYSGASIHAEMLQDQVRTGAYHSFIVDNPALFDNRLVIDVGCGSGILSMFAARSGARVLAVDCASVLEEAVAAAGDNGLSERINFHRGKLEQLSELRGANADAIVSEWMGYFLLYEGMIESVIFARDHCLRQGGSVYPRVCSLYLCGIECPEMYASRVLYFDDVYGVRLSYLKNRALNEAHVTYDLRPEWVATDSALLRSFDLLVAKPEDTRFLAVVRLTAQRDCTLHALVGYFDTDFLGPNSEGDDSNKNVLFSTGPLAPMTHWGQTLFWLRKPLQLTKGQTVELEVSVGQPAGHPRGVSVGIQWPAGSGDGDGESDCRNQQYLMQ